MTEVFREFEAEHTAQTYCHIAVAREIKINLKRECGGIYPEKQNGFFIGLSECIAKAAESVGEQNLFAESRSESQQTVREFFNGMCSVVQIVVDIGIADNRPCNKLREQRNIERKADKVLLGGSVASVYIDVIAYRLEGIEAYTDWQSKLEKRNFRAENSVDG